MKLLRFKVFHWSFDITDVRSFTFVRTQHDLRLTCWPLLTGHSSVKLSATSRAYLGSQNVIDRMLIFPSLCLHCIVFLFWHFECLPATPDHYQWTVNKMFQSIQIFWHHRASDLRSLGGFAKSQHDLVWWWGAIVRIVYRDTDTDKNENLVQNLTFTLGVAASMSVLQTGDRCHKVLLHF